MRQFLVSRSHAAFESLRRRIYSASGTLTSAEKIRCIVHVFVSSISASVS